MPRRVMALIHKCILIARAPIGEYSLDWKSRIDSLIFLILLCEGPICCVNVLYLFYSNGWGHELHWVAQVLESRAYILEHY